MVSKTIKVCVRTRPTAAFAQNEITIEPEKNTITVQKQTSEETILNNAQSNFKFQFHHVLHNASQETVYETLSRDVVQDVVEGVNGTIMTYGQTGSGKTFTMLGDQNNYTHRGVAPRAIAQIFSEVGLRIETQFRISCTYMEIYNERIFDLLKSLGSEEARSDYAIVEEKGGRGVIVRGLTEVEVTTEAEALNLLFSGQLARTTAQHKLNRTSNRSHCIFSIVLQQQSRSGVSEKIVTSKLNLVDLAGSERLKKTMEKTGETIDGTLKKESMYINQSLTYLEQCVVALARRNNQHVAYRQTKLTSVLKDSLGGNCATLLFACIWGEAAHLEETISTLRLASRMMRVQNNASAVETQDPTRHAKRQDAIIRELRQELLMHNALAERSSVKYEPYSTEEKAALAQQLRRYAEAGEGKGDDILQFESVRQMKEMCEQFKSLLKNAEDRAQMVRQETLPHNNSGTLFQPAAEMTMTQPERATSASVVGELRPGSGFALGTAPDLARPISTEFSRNKHAEMESLPAFSPDLAELSGGENDGYHFPASPTKTAGVAEKNRAFEDYKRSTEGSGVAATVSRAKARRLAARDAARDSANLANQAKEEIDHIAELLLEKRSQQKTRFNNDSKNVEEDDVVDEEEFSLMKSDRDAKRGYREAHASYLTQKKEHDAARSELDSAKTALIRNFENWFSDFSGIESTHIIENYATDSFDKLDDQENFDKMETERIVSQDPDALAFFQAQKTRRANMTQNRTQLRQLHRNKRS